VDPNLRPLIAASAGPRGRAVAIGLLLGIGGMLIRIALVPVFGYSLPFIIAFPIVAVAAMSAGLIGGLVATTTSAVFASVVLLTPIDDVQIDDFLGLGFFVGGGLLISVLGGQVTASRESARAAGRRARLVADVSALLAQRIDQGATLAALTKVVVPGFADWCAIDLFDEDGAFVRAEIAAPDTATVDIAQRLRERYPYERDAQAGVAAVLRTGEPEVVLQVPGDLLGMIADPELRETMERLAICSYISVPATGPTGRRFGVLTVVMSKQGRRFAEDDVPTTVDLGRRIGAALETAALIDDTSSRAEELNAIIESMEDPVLVAAHGERIRILNRAAEAQFGDVRGRSMSDLLDDLPRAPGDGSVLAVPSTGQFLRPVQIRTEAAGTPVRIVILRDVTEMLEADAARDAFLGMLSHELRTPITTIYGSAQMLQRPISADDRAGLTKDIVAEAERLHRLTEDLLVLSRFERGSLTVSSEPLLARRVIASLLRRIGETAPSLRVSLHPQPEAAPVMADATYLEQIVRNLISNAQKYAGPSADIEVTITRNGDVVEIAVEDDGPGIPEGDIERVFGLYERLSATSLQPGAGVGLFVCRRLAEAMGGSIVAQRGNRGGARFVLSLPGVAAEPDGDGDFAPYPHDGEPVVVANDEVPAEVD
jgi:K+-sensing histidine kinase KdpD